MLCFEKGVIGEFQLFLITTHPFPTIFNFEGIEDKLF